MTWEMPGPAWLFCPADRPERYEKAAAAADVVILDLEDGVAPGDKAAARAALAATPLDPERTVVRVNAFGTEDHALDLRALVGTRYRRVMLPKCEAREQVASLTECEVIALIESPAGALTVADVMRVDNAIGVMWGAEDLVAALGGNSSRHADNSYRDVARHVRSTALLAAKAHGKFALDSVYLDIRDLDGLRAESDDAVAVGFDAKVAIHPGQLPVIRAAYAPSADEIDWARRVLAEVPKNRGVFAFEGRMVDGPVVRHAERILQRAAPDGPGD
ncbi:HpcH/HpaI aldolase/citrate lyase family protein [Nocardia blacklockiae]|uniref:HpcH/HpaI aldolase/citrate lyase family protein n=1 Tax=Nocardia blacklockiae TaxID=480036 RepID=UPI0018954907|nr:CoA ester lyase [Nocardia blacklockiae]MBF6172736.1 CoA ester lyase [Nocardia blacklockiae]